MPDALRVFAFALSVAIMPAIGLAQTAPTAAVRIDAPMRPTWRYAHGSFSLLGGTALTGEVAAFGNGVGSAEVRHDLVARGVLPFGLALQLEAGLDAGFVTGASGGSAYLAIEGNAGFGWAFAFSDRVALTPMLLYGFAGPVVATRADTVAPGSPRARIELPLTLFLGPHAFIEPAIDLVAHATPFLLAPGFAFRAGATF